MLTFPEAIVVGVLQGVTELFPVSSLGHAVLVPAWIGGRWATDLNVSTAESPYLAFIVGMHVATAVALLVFFWRDWVRIVRGFLSSLRERRVVEPDQRLAWLLILATIPVGVTGLLLEHTFRTVLSKPVPVSFFLLLNGVILLLGERMRRRRVGGSPALAAAGVGVKERAGIVGALPARTASRDGAAATAELPEDLASDHRIGAISYGKGVAVGSAQIAALCPGISRSGVTMVGGLLAGLSHEDAARFAFLLATPVIMAAGVLKVPDLAGPLGDGVRAQVLVGSLAAGVSAYLSVRFLTRWFQTRTLTPFGIYSLGVGLVSLVWFGLH